MHEPITVNVDGGHGGGARRSTPITFIGRLLETVQGGLPHEGVHRRGGFQGLPGVRRREVREVAVQRGILAVSARPPIHPSAWKANSRNFPSRGFSEVGNPEEGLSADRAMPLLRNRFRFRRPLLHLAAARHVVDFVGHKRVGQRVCLGRGGQHPLYGDHDPGSRGPRRGPRLRRRDNRAALVVALLGRLPRWELHSDRGLHQPRRRPRRPRRHDDLHLFPVPALGLSPNARGPRHLERLHPHLPAAKGRAGEAAFYSKTATTFSASVSQPRDSTLLRRTVSA